MADDGFETRVYPREECELRVESRGLAPVIRGYAIVWNQLSQNLGGFIERIHASAIDRTLVEGVDLRAFREHDPSRLLGRQKARTLRIEKDARGLAVEIDPPPTSEGADTVALIRRGDLDGMSFSFRVPAGGDRWDAHDRATGLPIRDVVDMLVREVSIVSMPAYPQTEVAMRSLAAARLSQAQAFPRGRTVAERRAWAQAQAR